MYGVPEVIRAVTRHSSVPACSADVEVLRQCECIERPCRVDICGLEVRRRRESAARYSSAMEEGLRTVTHCRMFGSTEAIVSDASHPAPKQDCQHISSQREPYRNRDICGVKGRQLARPSLEEEEERRRG
ncbi:hypothetical protein EYF80_009556 [Liparis tanakae]|uniref:Uncharacterized protein n=1 Tax=Liparis tanakae TaxID=230148 RepID=A0A4Z2IQY1_9TELE|nr:hypothetical protein EYF80_009556 [Liparis tanakae]